MNLEELWEKHSVSGNPADEWEPPYMTYQGFLAALKEDRSLANTRIAELEILLKHSENYALQLISERNEALAERQRFEDAALDAISAVQQQAQERRAASTKEEK